ncbi:GTA-gp10 family protein [Paracoccus nototheniae]|uniref:GTA-gp10 family protein n=1 Tax=Paracoccus nototheniae TaxID=2489002 RepID=A0ABW4DZP8_9RHOB|nr:GTA-gp10 family protein [Paracoccus nototheniae]
MANGFKGQVSVEYEGSKYLLTLDFNALADFEGETGEDPLAVLGQYEKSGQITMVNLRALFWACLNQEHPTLTVKDAGRIMSANPEALMKALAAIQPEADPEAARGAAEGKPKARGKARAG